MSRLCVSCMTRTDEEGGCMECLEQKDFERDFGVDLFEHDEFCSSMRSLFNDYNEVNDE